MRRGLTRSSVLIAFLFLSGCAGSIFDIRADRPVISVDYGAAALAYADGKAAYSLLAKAVGDACAAGRIGPAACQDAAKIHERVQMAEAFLRDGLRNPQRPIDWDKVTQLLGAIVSLALKLAT